MEGLKTLKSEFGPEKTMDRLEAEIKAHGMTVFARINHAALAAEAGMTLRPDRGHCFRQSTRRHTVNAGKADNGH